MDIYDGQQDMEIEFKDGDMPLTKADRAANQIIMQRLRKEFPDYAVLSEEEQDNLERLRNDLCFIVDPLDGTKEFIKRNGQFTVNIALSYRHRSVMGVIYVPVDGTLYYAAEGQGCFMEKKGSQKMRLEVDRSIKEKSKLRMVMSSSHGCAEMDRLLEKYQITDFLKIGSSLKGCMVAEGKADVYYRFNPTMEWDTAAMQCIVEEAGAIFRQMDDSEMLYNRENSLNEKGFYIINFLENKL